MCVEKTNYHLSTKRNSSVLDRIFNVNSNMNAETIYSKNSNLDNSTAQNLALLKQCKNSWMIIKTLLYLAKCECENNIS